MLQTSRWSTVTKDFPIPTHGHRRAKQAFEDRIGVAALLPQRAQDGGQHSCFSIAIDIRL